jgi:hypothetical protein
VFSLYYERRHNVIMTRLTGVLSSEDIEEHDRSVLLFLAGLFASERQVRGLYDFSQVEALAVPISKMTQRGQRPAIIDGFRVVVPPDSAAGLDFVRLIADQLRAAGHREPVIADTLEEAYRLLGLENPQFDRVEQAL